MAANQDTPKLSRAESARINGAKSSGAKTPEGKVRAANGNFKHGAYSARVVMENENFEAYQELYSFYTEIFQPQDAFEGECVTTMVNTRWRLRRLEVAETANLDAAVVLNKPYVEARFDRIDIPHERALAIQREAANRERMTRVEDRLHRLYERNYKLLTNYRHKSGRSTPAGSPDTPDLQQPVEPETPPIPQDPPNSESPEQRDLSSTLAKIALFLVIFALLALVPGRVAAKPLIAPLAIYESVTSSASHTRLESKNERLFLSSSSR